MMRETQLAPDDFIYPIFVVHGEDVRRPITSMPGIFQLSVDQAVTEAGIAASLGVPAVLLFGVPASKDAEGSENYSPDGIVQRAVLAVKRALPEMVVVVDLCLCEYTDHGHCGIIVDGQVSNDATLPVLRRAARSYAEAGADILAPSGMMDGMVAAIRAELEECGRPDVGIMSYTVKYASALYGPFRDAAEGAPRFGDRRSHQMDPANAREALRELQLDITEGADIVMVKPALAYLDIVRSVRESCNVPVAAYNVSGEYAMVKAAAAQGWLDERAVTLEMLTGIKRAGADLIITYHSLDAARWLA
jgi:porphobilinogen synthase